jgi:hypothetical protein
MNLITIPANSIHFDPPDETDPIDKGFAEELAKSIKADGCLHPPTVTPIEPVWQYRLVAGKHRLYAMVDLLGGKEVECCNVENVDLKHAEAMTLAENIWRKKLSEADFNRAMIRWRDLYVELNPDADGSGGSNKKAETPRPAGEFSAAFDGTPARPAPFYKEVQSTLGVSPAKATRIARRAKNLTEDQVTALASHNVNGTITDKIAALGKGEPIDRAVELVTSGTIPEDAIRQAAKLKPPKVSKAAKPGRSPTSPDILKRAELTDEEWLNTFCAKPLANLKHKISFKIDAIFYRRMQESLNKFRGSMKKHLAASKSSIGLNGQFYGNMYRIFKASHPMHWLVCAVCGGTGKSEDDATKKCTKCWGGAYIMKLED